MSFKVEFSNNALEDFKYWEKNNSPEFFRIKELLLAIQTDPFKGIGKPEKLKYEYSGYWSRRISSEHRLIYRMIKIDHVFIKECRGHYRRKK